MTAYRNVGGTFRACPAIYRNVGGTWRTVIAGWRNVGGTWRQFFANAPTVIINPGYSQGYASRAGTVSGNSVQAQVSGGSGSFTYSWTKVGDSRITITNPNAASTSFTASLRANDEADATATCTVTDTVTGQQGSSSISVQLVTSGNN